MATAVSDQSHEVYYRAVKTVKSVKKADKKCNKEQPLAGFLCCS